MFFAPAEGLGDQPLAEERRREGVGLREQKDLLDQSCVCVIELRREAGLLSFPALSVLGS